MKKFFLGLLAALTIISGTAGIAGHASADSTDYAKKQVCQVIKDNAGDDCGAKSSKTLAGVIQSVLKLLSVVAGIAAVIMVIIAGMKYVTSGGEAAAIGSAKKTLIYALVGLIIVVTAQVLVRFVLKQV